MKSRENRRYNEAKKQKQHRELANNVGWFYTRHSFKNKEDKYEFDPYKCYCTDGKKQNSRKFFKRESNKAIRNWHKKELRKHFEDAGSCNNKSKKIYDYWWTID